MDLSSSGALKWGISHEQASIRVWGLVLSFRSLEQVTKAVCKTVEGTCEVTRKLPDRTQLDVNYGL